jgi:hypothetical protein
VWWRRAFATLSACPSQGATPQGWGAAHWRWRLASRRPQLTRPGPSHPSPLPPASEVARHYHNSYAINDFSKNCADPVNAPCHASQGCSLFDRMQKACGTAAQQARCKKAGGAGFVYAGRHGCATNPVTKQSDQGHVISIAVAPVRGMEDVVDSAAAAKATSHMFKAMWDESLANKTGSNLDTGFTARSGGLIVNPPSHREFHQLHVHAGAWRTPAFEACLARMTESKAWQRITCPGLSEGGEVANCAKPPAGQSCQSATLAYKTVTDLSPAWADYRDGLKQLGGAVSGATAGELKYFAGLMATRGPALAGHRDQKFVIVYAPADVAAHSGLGRGHFFLKGEPHSTQHC